MAAFPGIAAALSAKRALTLQILLLAATAIAALTGAAFISVPSEGEVVLACIYLGLCF
jgi:hypothetical protein